MSLGIIPFGLWNVRCVQEQEQYIGLKSITHPFINDKGDINIHQTRGRELDPIAIFTTKEMAKAQLCLQNHPESITNQKLFFFKQEGEMAKYYGCKAITITLLHL